MAVQNSRIYDLPVATSLVETVIVVLRGHMFSTTATTRRWFVWRR